MNPIKSNGLAAANNQPAESKTLCLDYPASACRSKAEANLIARMALAGHLVHRGRAGGYVSAKWGYTCYSTDLADLHAFAVPLGVCNE